MVASGKSKKKVAKAKSKKKTYIAKKGGKNKYAKGKQRSVNPLAFAPARRAAPPVNHWQLNPTGR